MLAAQQLRLQRQEEAAGKAGIKKKPVKLDMLIDGGFIKEGALLRYMKVTP